MKPFTVHRGRVAPLDRVNVDTDQIIPKQFLKRIEKTGFRAVISSSFADIFANNSTKNGFLAVRLNDDEVEQLMRRAQDLDDYQITIDLEKCEVRDDQGFRATFPIDEFTRHCLLNGLDDIALTLQHEAEIKEYEAKRPAPSALKAS